MDRANIKSPQRAAVSRILNLRPGGQSPDILLRTGGAVPLRLIRAVGIGGQREGGGRVPKIILHRLYIVPALEACHGVGVPEVVKAGGIHEDKRAGSLSAYPPRGLPRCEGGRQAVHSAKGQAARVDVPA